jgi:hypothetical protein
MSTSLCRCLSAFDPVDPKVTWLARGTGARRGQAMKRLLLAETPSHVGDYVDTTATLSVRLDDAIIE